MTSSRYTIFVQGERCVLPLNSKVTDWVEKRWSHWTMGSMSLLCELHLRAED